MDVDSSGNIPVQAVLKLIVDQQGSSQVDDVLNKQDQSFSKVEATVGRIGDSLESITRSVAGLAGVASLGAVVDKFVKIETSASNIALAMGKVTGGSGTYSGIRQEELGVQSRTGVSTGEQEAALRSLAMSVGLSPRPGQAGMLAEVIAGYSRVTGVSSASLASIVGPMLQAEGRGSSPSATAFTLGEARANLGAFPGSQIEGMLPVASALSTSAALGTAQGAGKGVSVGGISALINTIAGPHSVLRQPGIAQQAAEGIGGTLQGAYANPQVYAILKMAKISFKESQLGFNSPKVQEKLVEEVRRQYPGDTEADWGERRRVYLALGQGEAGADALERIEKVSHDGRTPIHVATPKMKKEASERHHAQTLTTPEAFLSKTEANIEHGMFSSIPNAILGGAGILAAPSLLKLLGKGAKGLFAGAEEGGTEAAGSLGIDSLLGPAGLAAAVSTIAGQFVGGKAGQVMRLPGTLTGDAIKGWEGVLGIGGSPVHASIKQSFERQGGFFASSSAGSLAKAAMREAEKTYGSGFWHDDAGGEKANQLMRSLLEGKTPFFGKGADKLNQSTGGKAASEALGMLDPSIKKMREYSELGAQGYATKQFSEAVEKFARAVDKEGGKNASYTGGGGMHNASYVGAPLIAAMQATNPGMVMAAFLGRSGTSSGGSAPSSSGPGTTPVSFTTSGNSSGWNSILEKYSGGSYGLSHVEQLAGEHSGSGAHPGDRQTVEADAKKYGIPFNVLWGIYGAESSFGKAASNFGLTGQYPGVGTSGNFGTDARTSAEDLANLAKQMHLHVHVEVGGQKVEQHKTKVGAPRAQLT